MGLNIEQALQKGVTARKSGNIQEAVSIFHNIIKKQPRHQNALHELGLIAMSADQIANNHII